MVGVRWSLVRTGDASELCGTSTSTSTSSTLATNIDAIGRSDGSYTARFRSTHNVCPSSFRYTHFIDANGASN